jgi:hypothetical protein
MTSHDLPTMSNDVVGRCATSYDVVRLCTMIVRYPTIPGIADRLLNMSNKTRHHATACDCPRWLRRRTRSHDYSPMSRDHPKCTHRRWSYDVLRPVWQGLKIHLGGKWVCVNSASMTSIIRAERVGKCVRTNSPCVCDMCVYCSYVKIVLSGK